MVCRPGNDSQERQVDGRYHSQQAASHCSSYLQEARCSHSTHWQPFASLYNIPGFLSPNHLFFSSLLCSSFVEIGLIETNLVHNCLQTDALLVLKVTEDFAVLVGSAKYSTHTLIRTAG